jgi:hypothetical protein
MYDNNFKNTIKWFETYNKSKKPEMRLN